MDKNKIIKMLEYSGMSYSDDNYPEGNEIVYSINDRKTDVSYHVRLENDAMTVAFRGSDSKKDWNFNLNFLKKVIPYGNSCSKIKVHSGFINAYKHKNVRDKIRSFVDKNIKRITLTGHSYGAALAALCAIDLQYSFSDKDYEVILFGCPRIGNKAFRESYNKRIFKTLRVETKGDIITMLPFKFMGYRHIGSKLLLGKNGIFKFPNMKSHQLQEYYSRIWDV